MFSFGFLGRGDRDQFDFGELMLADHAARVFSGGARFGPKTRRTGGVAPRQRGFIDDGFADEVCERHFGGGDEPEPFK